MRGTFLIYNSWAHFLFDSGASHSFLSASFARSLELELDVLESPIFVDTPFAGRVRLDRICRGCEFTMGDHQFALDFIVLDMYGFDLILGMGWLSFVHDHIDCHRRRVRLFSLEGLPFCIYGDRKSSVDSALYDLREHDSISYMLASLCLDDDSSRPVELPPVVSEFADVFPSDLLGLPPSREVEFAIDLLPGTYPLSVAPYRFAPTKL